MGQTPKQLRKKILKQIELNDDKIDQREFNRILQAVMPTESGGLAEAIQNISASPAPVLNKETPILSSEEAKLMGIPDEEAGAQMSLFRFYSDFSASPNIWIRSALFPPHENTKKREIIPEWTPIVAFEKEACIEIKGERFSQYENDLVMVLIRLYSEKGIPFDKPLETSTLAILKKLGLKNFHKKNYEAIARSMDRLTTSPMKLKYYWSEYIGSILHDAFIDKKSGRWIVQLNPKLVTLFQDGQYTYIPLDIHFSLKRSLSKWLHQFLTSHDASKNHFAISIKKLHILCGSRVKSLPKFRQQIKASLLELEEIGVVRKGWSIRKDVLRVRVKRRAIKSSAISNVKKEYDFREVLDHLGENEDEEKETG